LVAISHAAEGILTWQKGNDHLLVELESAKLHDCPVRYDNASGGKAAVLAWESSRIEVKIHNEAERTAEIWIRCYFDYERCAAGDANSFFWKLDEREKRAFSSNDKDRWLWAKLDRIELARGEHALVFEPRERPSRLDCLVLFGGEDAAVQSWYAADFADGLPFGLRNTLPRSRAQRISHWRLAGEGARQTRAALDRDDCHQLRRSIKLRLPVTAAPVVLVSGRAIRSAPEEAPELQPQVVSLCVKRLGAGIDVTAIGTDADGDYFRAALPSPAGADWQTLMATLPDGLRAPIEVTHVAFVNRGKAPAEVLFEEPKFARPYGLRIAKGTANLERDRFSCRLELTWKDAPRKNERRACTPKAWWRIGSAEGARYGMPDAKGECTFDAVADDGACVVMVRAKLPADRPEDGALAFRYGIGSAARPAYLFSTQGRGTFAAWNRRRERAAGAFRFDPEGRDRPLRTHVGRPVRPDQVAALYGKDFAVLADGIDVCSARYKDEASNLRLRPVARDLSDEAGWPDMPVTPGELAIDPALGRFRFSEGNGAHWAEVGFCRTGFGVPGLPIAVQGDFAFAPAREGDLTVLDIRDLDHPKIAAFLPTWCFYGGPPMPCGRWLYGTFRLGRGKPMVMLADINDPFCPGKFRPTSTADGALLWIGPDGRNAVYLSHKEPRSLVRAEIVSPGQFEERGSLAGIQSAQVRADGLTAAAVIAPGNATRMRPDILMVDLTDKSKPRLVSRIASETRLIEERGKENLTTGWPCVLSKRYLAVRYHRTLEVIRIDKPGKPVWVASHDFGEEGGFPCCAVHDGRLYVSTGPRLLRYRLDAFRPPDEEEELFGGDPEAEPAAGPEDELWKSGARGKQKPLPPPVARPRSLSTFPEPEAAFDAPEGWHLQGMVVHEGRLFVSDAHYGLRIFDDTEKGFRLRGSAMTAAEGRFAFSVSDELAAIAHTFGGQLWTVDVRDPTRPRVRAVLGDGHRLRYSVRHAHKYPCLYLAKESGRVEAVDVSDPTRPRVVWHAKDSAGDEIRPASVRVAYGRLFLVGRDAVLYEYDLAEPRKPALRSQVKLSPQPQYFRITTWKSHLFALGQRGLVAVDVSAPGAPRLAGTLDISEHMKEITEGYAGNPTVSSCTVVRGVLFATTGGLIHTDKLKGGQTKLDMYDVRDPASMRSLGLFDPVEVGGWGDLYGDVISYGPRLFSATFVRIEMTDVSDPFRPKRMPDHVRFGESIYQFSAGELRGRYLYVPANGGLVISRPPLPSEVPKGKVLGRVGVADGN